MSSVTYYKLFFYLLFQKAFIRRYRHKGNRKLYKTTVDPHQRIIGDDNFESLFERLLDDEKIKAALSWLLRNKR